MLKLRGSSQVASAYAVFRFCTGYWPVVPEEGTVNLEIWNKVGDRLRAHYMAEGLEYMPIFTFVLWYMIKDWLGPTLSHKERCGTHPL
jgi:hypothetical protein